MTTLQRRRFLLVLCSCLALTTGVARAEKSPSTSLKFVVTAGPDPQTAGPRSGRLLVVLGRPEDGEPRLAVGHTGKDAAPILGRDALDLAPGGQAILDEHSAIFPIQHLAQLRPGLYAVQALLHINRNLNTPNAPGDLYSPVKTVQLDPAAGGAVTLELSQAIPHETLPPDDGLIRHVTVRSTLLSKFHGRPIDLRAGVLLPRDFDRETDRRYPLRVHIGGYGARFNRIAERMAPGSQFHAMWMGENTPRMILVMLDGAGPLGDPYQVNSANHGPYGDAVTRELIPTIEQRFRGIGKGSARVLEGGSTGGWVALALQVFYPDFWAGAWSFCPDSVDFRSFQLMNVYEDHNAYLNRHGFERPGSRDISGEVRTTMRHECQLENVLGMGDSWAMSGGQWGAWNATYGPRGVDGRPVPLWDPRTGAVNRSAVEDWKAYDLRRVLESGWPTLSAKLQGKLHIWVGEADDYFLNNAVHQLDDFLSNVHPPYEGSITYGPRQGHCWMGISETEIMKQMDRALTAKGGLR